VARSLRERVLAELRRRGLQPKPLVADPFERAHALLEFIRLIEKDEPAFFICLDEPEAVLTRMVAGHARGAVLMLPAGADAGQILTPATPAHGRPYAIVQPPTAEALLEWIGAAYAAEPLEEAAPSEPEPLVPPVTQRSEQRKAFSREDEEWLERLAQDFRPRLREGPRAPVVAPRPQALDFSHELRRVISNARDLATDLRNEFVTPLHYLAAIAGLPECAGHRLLIELGVVPAHLDERVRSTLPRDEVASPATFAPSDEATELVARSKRLARERNRRALTTADLLEGMLGQDGSDAASILGEFGITPERLAQVLAEIVLPEERLPEDDQKPPPEPPAGFEINPAQVMELRERLGARKAKPARHAPERPAAVSTEETRSPEEASIRITDVLEAAAEPTGVAHQTDAPKAPLVLPCDATNPPLEVVEQAADALLEGRVVALPTDTGYVLAVDATNREAVERLYQISGRERTSPLAVLVHSTMQLRHIVREIPQGASALMDTFWPGPLTLVFRRHPSVFAGVASDDSIGIRLPNDYVALAILSMVGRPLAATGTKSADGRVAREAGEIAAQFGDKVDMIIDAGPAPESAPSTVLSLVEKPWRVLRGGPISRQQLEEIAGVPIAE
jgi:L-threonylcarbamoyladenylate synthase